MTMRRARRSVATLAGISAAVTSMSGTLAAFAPAASAAPAPGQDVLNDWGQTSDEVAAEVTPIVDADARVVAARARYSRALLAYSAIKRVETTALNAYASARRTASKVDDTRTAATLSTVRARVLAAAREVVASQLNMVNTVKNVEAQVRSHHYIKAPFVAVPAQPTNVTAVGSTGQVALTWDAVPGATTYRVYRDNVQIATTVVAAFTDSGLDNGSAYGYTVIAQNVAGWSPVSVEVVGVPSAGLPSVPTSVVAAPGDGQVSLAWAAGTNTTGYRVYRDSALVGSTASASFTDVGVTNGTSYSYTVVAVNATDSSAPSGAVLSTPVATAPAAPSGLTAVPGNGQVMLAWTAPAGATSYGVYRGGVLVGSPTATGFTDTGLTNGTSYAYRVVAFRQNSPASPQSTSVSATPVAPALPVPTGLAATPGDTQVALTWTSVSGATSYRVYRGAALIASPTVANFTDTGLANGTTYAYYVVAVGPSSTSAASATVTATPAVSAPGAPTGLTGQAGDTIATLTWSPVSGASSYNVYRGGVLVASIAATAYTVTSLTNGTPYSFYVTAVKSGVESAASAGVTVTPFVVTPGVPTGIVATPGSAQVSLTWLASANAQSYKVYRGATLVGSPTTTSFTDTGLVNGTTYSYTVVAVNGTASSVASTAVTATPMAPAPGAPSGLTATPGNAQVSLSWTAVVTATSYRIYRNGALVGSATGTTYLDTALINSTTYTYYVIAVAATTPGPASTSVTATPVLPPVSGTFTGATTTITGHGTLHVVIVLSNSVITSATGTLLTNDGSETVSINSTAIPKYNTKAVTANSANITKVSGATLTWTAYKTSLQSALTQAGL